MPLEKEQEYLGEISHFLSQGPIKMRRDQESRILERLERTEKGVLGVANACREYVSLETDEEGYEEQRGIYHTHLNHLRNHPEIYLGQINSRQSF